MAETCISTRKVNRHLFAIIVRKFSDVSNSNMSNQNMIIVIEKYYRLCSAILRKSL